MHEGSTLPTGAVFECSTWVQQEPNVSLYCIPLQSTTRQLIAMKSSLVLVSCLLAPIVFSSVAWAQFQAPETVLNVLPDLHDAAVFDWDRDGDDDLVVLHSDGFSGFQLYAYERQAAGNFGSVVQIGLSGLRPGSIKITDFDQDGFEDVVVGGASFNPEGLYWNRNLMGQSFAPLTPLFSVPTIALDYDFVDITHDGIADFVWLPGDDTLSLRVGMGAGQFAAPQSVPLPQSITPHSKIVPMDVNGDTLVDLLIPSVFAGLSVWMHWVPQSGLTLVPTGTGFAIPGPAIPMDTDEDGDDDLVYVNSLTARPYLIPNLGGNFGPQIFLGHQLYGSRTLSMDLDGDGDQEVFFHSAFQTGIVWYDNQGSGALAPSNMPSSPPSGNALLATDFDGDGAQDILAHNNLTNQILLFKNGSTLGSTTCTAQPNSTGLGAQLSARGTSEASENRLQFRLTQAPPGGFAMLLNSQMSGMSTPAGSSGTLCLGGLLGRYNRPGEYGQISAQGQWDLRPDLANTPTALGVTVVQTGQSWHFQAWFRDLDPGPTSNFSDGLVVMFR